MKRVAAVLVALVFYFAVATGWAQGTIGGRIESADARRPLPDAEVVVRDAGLRAATDPSGRFRITGVPAGTWVVEIRRIGFRPLIVSDVVVRTDRLTAVDVALEPMPLELATIEARPSFFIVDPSEPVSRAGFSGEEVRRAPGAAGDVSRIMQSLPSLAKVNDQSNGLIVRGGSPLENLILVDGIEVPSINHFPVQGSSSGPIGLLNVDLIRGAELSAGGFGAAYGDRLSSVFDIRLREGNREAVDAQFDLNFVGYGAVAEGPLGGGRGTWLVSARRSYFDLVVKAFDVGTTVAPAYGDYQAKATWELSPAHRLALLAIWADDHLDTDLETALANDMLAFGRQELVQGTTGLAWNAFWNDRVQSTTTVAHGLARFDEDYFDPAAEGAPLLRNRSRDVALRLRHGTSIRPADGVELTLGGDLARTRFRFDNRYFARTGPLGEPVPELEARGALTEWRGGGFASLAVTPLSPLTITAGARVDHAGLSGMTTVSPRGAVALRTGERTTVSLAGGLYRQGMPGVLLVQRPAHRALPDARAWHVVAGVNHLLREALRLSIEVYHKRTDRLWTDPATPGLLPVDELFHGYGFLTARDTLLATGTSRATGAEVLLQQKLSRRVYGLVSASVFRSTYRAADGIRRDRVFDNRVLFAAEGGVKAGRGFDLSARWLFGGGAPYTPLDLTASSAAGRTILDADRINAERYPAYHSLNLRVDRSFQIGRTTLRGFLSAWNVYGRRNVAQYFWSPVTNRQEAVLQWGMLPVFGVEWEF